MNPLLALFAREMRLAWAGGGGAAGPAAFNLAALSLAPLAIGPAPEILTAAAPGIIAFAMLLSTLQSSERLFGEDAADGTLELYLLSGQGFTLVCLAKTLAFALAVFWPAPVIAALAGIAYGMSVEASLVLALGLALAAPGLALLAGFAGALAAGVKRAGLLIALIAAPLQVPLLVFAAGAGRAALDQTGTAGANLMLAAAVSLAALVLAPAGIAAALKARLE
ncbi:cytochrome C biogenesis protein [Marinicauda algicola]|uniref:Heme exporter protein B n=1 Tax=Marinicauda algicola TaxID=2029849 RepID=A0A4S2H1A3_9PROT|nr:heme exporter protein CcmB [Marinicauda algicola]TGY89320.1 cytochrome C biogenesis protein [Marinicauda algicola]